MFIFCVQTVSVSFWLLLPVGLFVIISACLSLIEVGFTITIGIIIGASLVILNCYFLHNQSLIHNIHPLLDSFEHRTLPTSLNSCNCTQVIICRCDPTQEIIDNKIGLKLIILLKYLRSESIDQTFISVEEANWFQLAIVGLIGISLSFLLLSIFFCFVLNQKRLVALYIVCYLNTCAIFYLSYHTLVDMISNI